MHSLKVAVKSSAAALCPSEPDDDPFGPILDLIGHPFDIDDAGRVYVHAPAGLIEDEL